MTVILPYTDTSSESTAFIFNGLILFPFEKKKKNATLEI